MVETSPYDGLMYPTPGVHPTKRHIYIKDISETGYEISLCFFIKLW